MSTYKGKNLKIEIVGESHSSNLKGVVKGLPKFKIDFDKLNAFLERRKATGEVYSTKRKEEDSPIFFGIKKDTIKNKLKFIIKNNDINKNDYSYLYGIPRPSHADYAWYLKDGALDFSGGGRFSGRLTLPLCVVGGLCLQYLEEKGVKICSYIESIGKVKGLSYKSKNLTYEEVVDKRKGFPSLSNKEKMLDEIKGVKGEGDSVGGKIECIVYNLNGGIGDNLFGGLEGKISSLLYSIPAVKGIEFGLGFGFSEKTGSDANDCLRYNQGEIQFLSNNNGGINGGISNGEPITIGIAVKPTPSIEKEQNTVNLVKKENIKIKIKGRHDACILPRALPCVESAVAIAILDEIL